MYPASLPLQAMLTIKNTCRVKFFPPRNRTKSSSGVVILTYPQCLCLFRKRVFMFCALLTRVRRLGRPRYWATDFRCLLVHCCHGYETGRASTSRHINTYTIVRSRYKRYLPVTQEEMETAFEKDFERFCPYFERDSDIENESQRITVKSLMSVFQVNT